MELRGRKSVGSVGEDRNAILAHDVLPAFGLHERTKRMLDIVAAAMGMILLAPILLISSIAIKLDSPGPIFVHEIKYGNKNRAIEVRKFRVAMLCSKGEQSNPQLTQVGRILRQTGIDELPQLFNVLRGEISIVGRQNIHRWQVSFY